MADNKNKLISTAAGLFMEQGYHGTGIEDILERSGVARSNFYYHFPGKVDLALAVTDFWIADYNENLVQPALGPEGTLFERLEKLYQLAADTQEADGGLRGCPLGQLSNELAASLPEVRDRLDSYFSTLIDRVHLLMKESMPDSCLDVRSLAVSAVAILEGGLMLSGLQNCADPMDQAGAGFISLIKELGG